MLEALANPVAISFIGLTVFWLINLTIYTKVEPIHQPFRRNDHAINKPLVKQTVTFTQIIAYTLLIPLVTLTISEHWMRISNSKQDTNFTLKCYFGWVALLLILSIVKPLTGRLRPNFLEKNNVTFDANDDKLHEGLELLNAKVAKSFAGRETRVSFFSGHAALGLYTAVFLILYFQEHISRSFYLHSMQMTMMVIGVYPGLTQGRNYHHHWSDVGFGYFAGASCAYMAYYYVL